MATHTCTRVYTAEKQSDPMLIAAATAGATVTVTPQGDTPISECDQTFWVVLLTHMMHTHEVASGGPFLYLRVRVLRRCPHGRAWQSRQISQGHITSGVFT